MTAIRIPFEGASVLVSTLQTPIKTRGSVCKVRTQDPENLKRDENDEFMWTREKSWRYNRVHMKVKIMSVYSRFHMKRTLVYEEK